jgi:uncharacterized repeat protein (TIGR01451 family)
LAKLRNVSLLAAVMLAVAVIAGATLFGKSDTAQAAPGDGIYEMAVSAPAVVGVGLSFTVDVSVDSTGEPAFSAVQWKIDYDQTVVSFVSATPIPAECTASSDDGDTTLLGCIDLAPPPSLTTNGVAWQVDYMCDTAGVSFLNLVETVGATAKTFVKIGTTAQPITTTNDTVICALLTDVSAAKVAPPLVTAGSPVVYTVTGTNNGPNPWTGAVVADNLPDAPGVTFVSATVDVDADGDAVYETVGAPCIPGFFPAFPNPAPPPAYWVVTRYENP